ncbi:MAG: hypothetical protein MZU97_20345 [Bacillus subtilis]|nr:hypothetical protein [Bacillus subtilis]
MRAKPLLGMDLIRLALERASSAKEAAECIVGLLQTHGQGGNAGFDRILKYDNAFLISDSKESLVLELYGQDWAVSQVSGSINISNRLPDSSRIIASSLDGNQAFSKKLQEPVFTFFSGSRNRQCAIAQTLSDEPEIGVKRIFDLLRSHQPEAKKKLFTKGSPKSVCMHKSLLGDHTTGSFVVDATRQLDDNLDCQRLDAMFGRLSPDVFWRCRSAGVSP